MREYYGAVSRSQQEALDHAIVVRPQQLHQLWQEEGYLQTNCL